MGRKGTSKPKSKKSNPLSNPGNSGSSKTHSTQPPTVQSLMKDNGASLNRGGMNPSAGSNKKQQKGI
jgi:hypothetical protein